MSNSNAHRKEVVEKFCEACIWARTVRNHFSALFEFNQRRLDLLEEVSAFFFHDLNIILIEYILLQLCKLTDPESTKVGKNWLDNLTTNYILTLQWSPETLNALKIKNDELMVFRSKIVDARRKLIAHSDLRMHLESISLGDFSESDEFAFWAALQAFVDLAHSEAIDGPYPIDATMQGGDALSLIHVLKDGVDYEAVVADEEGFLLNRVGKRRYEDA
ncbi:AbiU2 domain-containing protein [Ferribacterium limneticum]|uniref:AbiU2 domain-containing protein n=1 Tax=Ferribacterium limneticum TaxID=76259 RepID=UPI001CFA2445|nr:hypothetical protein [Ferribacterium limneticum]UCV19169.1 hypothetical protein KI610_00815 [Ferribacterium limneticum]